MANPLPHHTLPDSAVFALSTHADYRCRHSGACCTADWDVPIELPVYRSLAEAVTRGRLRVSEAAAPIAPFVVEPGLPAEAAAMLERTDQVECVFFDRRSRLCLVHRDLGEPALPLTCRHFPRLAVQDARGISITLSHFCPTAASMLFRTDVPLRIVAAPAAFPPRDYDGLAVTDEDLPPLLHPRMLMDLEGYAAWERHMVARCADDRRTPETVLATLARDASLLRRWRPGAAPLRDAVEALPGGYAPAPAGGAFDGSLDRSREVMAAVPPALAPARDEHGLAGAYARFVQPYWHAYAASLNRFIAAKAFASWTAYQGRGVATVVRGLEAAVALVRVEASRHCRDRGSALDAAVLLEAFRSADFVLNHLAVGEDLAAVWGSVEGGNGG